MAPPNKKRKLKESKTEEVVFDPSARFDYLTGFHKRKVQRTKHAQEVAAQRARQEKIDDRKRLREERKAEIEKHVEQVNSMLPKQNLVAVSDSDSQSNDNDEDWDGISEDAQNLVDHEEEYIDEDKYTTVTVEEVDVSRHGLSRVGISDEEPKAEIEVDGTEEAASKDQKQKSKPSWSKTKDRDKKPRKKKKNFRYESPAERKMNRAKERVKKSKAAKARRGE